MDCTSITHYMMGDMTVKLPRIRPYFNYSVLCYSKTSNDCNITKSFLSVRCANVHSASSYMASAYAIEWHYIDYSVMQ